MKPQSPKAVKLFTGLLYCDDVVLRAVYQRLSGRFGAIDYESPEYEFTSTDYYQPEMGQTLCRRFVSFANLVDPGDLPEIKTATNDIEAAFTVQGKRQVNLDPGYMDFNKIVLASAKYNSQKIYLSHGIYADPTLRYAKGVFLPYEHSFPDFKLKAYNTTFLEIRNLYKKQLHRRSR